MAKEGVYATIFTYTAVNKLIIRSLIRNSASVQVKQVIKL
jgi:hypothetical protein